MTKEEAIKTLKENCCVLCAYCAKDMDSCDISGCDNKDAIKALEQGSCTDAISREDALLSLCKAVHKNDDTIPCRNQIVSCLWNKTKVQDYAEEILKLSPVTPVGQKVGHWVSIGDFECRCSECHLWCYKRNRSRYCPSCGAKMQEVKE